MRLPVPGAQGRAILPSQRFETPIGVASHSAYGRIGRTRPEIGNRVRRVPQPRRPETVSRDGWLLVREPVTRPKGAAANNAIRTKNAARGADYRR